MSTLGISLLGAGRMGSELMGAIADKGQEYRLTGLWVRNSGRENRQDTASHAAAVAAKVNPSNDLNAVLEAADVAIDFTLPAANDQIIRAALTTSTPLVCGVSGLAETDMAAMRQAATKIPVFFERNMSIGIALLTRFVGQAGAILGTGFRAEIDDLHHAKKLDAPSGTALMLGEALAAARGQHFAEVMRYDPDSNSDSAAPGDIAFHARREGSHPGRHTVRLDNGDESITVEHNVADRRVFADGALRAAAWLRGQPAGFYGMQDLLASLDAD